MKQFSFAKALLNRWGAVVEDLPVSNDQGKKQADFLARLSGATILIEEKTKEDDADYLEARARELEQGQVHAASLPITRNETLSGVVRSASNQLRSSSTLPHDFRLVWFTATGVNARGQYEQFIATLYGKSNILEMNASNYRRCYYFRHADFFRRSAVLDGAVVAYTDGTAIHASLCLNPLSPRYSSLRRSTVLRPFGTAIEDPLEMEAAGTALVLDSDLDRKDEASLLAYLQNKYRTGPLMNFDLG